MSVIHTLVDYCNKSPAESISSVISTCLLDHINEINDLSVKDTAVLCSTSEATVNRQIKAMCGLTYKQFQKEVKKCLHQYPLENHCFDFSGVYSRSADGYLDCIIDQISKLKKLADSAILEEICDRMFERSCIRLYLPFSGSSSKSQFRMDLAVSGKKTIFLSTSAEWLRDSEWIDKNTLLFVSNSYKPNEFIINDFHELLIKAKEKGAYIVSFNASRRPDYKQYSDAFVNYDSTGTAMDHILIDVIFNLLKVIYRKKYMMY